MYAGMPMSLARIFFIIPWRLPEITSVGDKRDSKAISQVRPGALD
jgi:hypothetical protein